MTYDGTADASPKALDHDTRWKTTTRGEEDTGKQTPRHQEETPRDQPPWTNSRAIQVSGDGTTNATTNRRREAGWNTKGRMDAADAGTSHAQRGNEAMRLKSRPYVEGDQTIEGESACATLSQWPSNCAALTKTVCSSRRRGSDVR